MTFWGGVDTMQVTPGGSEDEVRSEVDRRVDVLGKDGGYVLCLVHNVQPDVPIENLLALYAHGKKRSTDQ